MIRAKMAELRYIVVSGVRFAAFQISNFFFCGLALTNILTEISGNVALSFLNFMTFTKI